MTSQSGGDAVNRGPAPEPGRGRAGEVAGDVREKGGEPSPDERERGSETSDADDCTAHDRAS